jgi:hypothetical protein
VKNFPDRIMIFSFGGSDFQIASRVSWV